MNLENQKFEFESGSENLFVKNKRGEIIASFYFNTRGFLPNFDLINSKQVYYHFPERAASTQIKEFKKAIKTGFIELKS